jgi:hypothetical protein
MSEAQVEDGLRCAELLDAWTVLSSNERREGFQLLPRSEQEELFLKLKTRDLFLAQGYFTVASFILHGTLL